MPNINLSETIKGDAALGEPFNRSVPCRTRLCGRRIKQWIMQVPAWVIEPAARPKWGAGNWNGARRTEADYRRKHDPREMGAGNWMGAGGGPKGHAQDRKQKQRTETGYRAIQCILLVTTTKTFNSSKQIFATKRCAPFVNKCNAVFHACIHSPFLLYLTSMNRHFGVYKLFLRRLVNASWDLSFILLNLTIWVGLTIDKNNTKTLFE